MTTHGIAVTVKSVRFGVDLRKVHALRQYWSPRLQRGQAVLFLNVARNKARLIDAMGGVHNYYADNGEVFDARAIQQQVAGLRLRLLLPAGSERQIDEVEEPQRLSA